MSEALSMQRQELVERLRSEQHRRWQRGERVPVESLCERHPELHHDESRLLDLIYAEIVMREQFGERPAIEEYTERFPQYEKQLRRQFLVHQAMATSWQESSADDADRRSAFSDVVLASGESRVEDRAPHESAMSDRADSSSKPDVPGYEILGELGRGGMGVVYLARQVRLNRVVALKMILAGPHASPQSLVRFRAEAEATALLEHANIVRVYDVGECEGRPYLALEFVDGVSLAERIRGVPQPPRQAAALAATVAHAIHAAHQHGIVHRDLKPGNILLDRRACAASANKAANAPHDSAGGAAESGEVKITDFGLAKQLDSGSDLTHTGDIVGTPSYMAPEQAGGMSHMAGPLVDVYAIGAILYEMLTGRPPFRGAHALETLDQVRRDEPVACRQLQPKVPRDLETICLKCLQKAPAKRYGSAQALARDLERFLGGEPIQARPTPMRERLWKWARRRPAAAALLAVSCLAVLGLLSMWIQLTANLRLERDRALHDRSESLRQKSIAESERQRAERHLYRSQVNLAQQAWDNAQMARMTGLLDSQRPAAGRDDLRGPEWYFLWQLAHAGLLHIQAETTFFRHLAFSADGKWLASADDSEQATLWDADSGSRIRSFQGHSSYVSAVSFSPDGRKLVTAGGDGTAKVWCMQSGDCLQTFKGHSAAVTAAAFSADSGKIATAGRDAKLCVWDAEHGTIDFQLTGHTAAAVALDWSPQMDRLVSASEDGTVRIWNLAARNTERTLESGGRTLAVAWSSDGLNLASGGEDGTVRLWDASAGQLVHALHGHGGPVTGVAFSKNGRTLASSSWDKTVCLWDVQTGRLQRSLRGHTGLSLAVAFHPDDQRVASAGSEIIVWDATSDQESREVMRHPAGIHAVAFSDTADLCATAGEDHAARVWNAATGDLVSVLTGHTSAVLGVVFTGDGRRLASCGKDRTVRIWSVPGGENLFVLSGHTDAVYGVAFSPDGQRLASAGRDHTVRIWNGNLGTIVRTLRGHAGPVRTVAFSPDGLRLVSGGQDGGLIVWDTALGEVVHQLSAHGAAVTSVAFSPDGSKIASAAEDDLVKIFSAARCEPLQVLQGHTQAVQCLAFDSDGSRLLSGSGSLGRRGEVKLWDLFTGEEFLTRQGHAREVIGVAFRSGGKGWLSAGRDGTVRFWDAPCPPEPAIAFPVEEPNHDAR